MHSKMHSNRREEILALAREQRREADREVAGLLLQQTIQTSLAAQYKLVELVQEDGRITVLVKHDSVTK